MKLFCIVIFWCVTMPLLRASDIGTIPLKFQKVLSLPQSTWTPSTEQVTSALAATQIFLEKPTETNERNREEIIKILKNSNGYRVQVWGVTQDGKKRIHLNFLPTPPVSGEDYHSYWTKQQVMVDDGGFYYWEAEIDLESGRLVLFRSNGYA